jgi:putative aldouronate transport system substrate-binding protein
MEDPMKRLAGGLCMMLSVICSLSARGAKQAPSGAAAPPAQTVKQDPFGGYDPVIALSTVRTMDSTIRFDQSDPDKRSFDENRWNKIFLETLGIKLSHKWIASDSNAELTRWNTSIASNDIPDFARVNDQVYKLLVDSDLAADMETTLKNYGSNRFLNMLSQVDYNHMSPHGTLLGFPGAQKGYNGTSVLWIRQDWLDRVRLPVPETLDDVIKTARAFKAAKLGGDETIGLLFSNNLSGGANNFRAGDGKWDGFFNAYNAYLNIWLEKDGGLVYSGIQPEIKTALLALRVLYQDGTINKDFAVTNDNIAREYVSSGKTGIFYSTAWNGTQSLQVLHNNEPGAVIINILPPPAKRGEAILIQTNNPKPTRIFVSNTCEYPEAVVKMANLTEEFRHTNYTYSYDDGEGFQYYKYLPWGAFAGTYDDLLKGHGFRYAEEHNGSLDEIPGDLWRFQYQQQYLKGKDGSVPGFYWHLLLNGPGGSFTKLYDAYAADQLLLDAYVGLPTETQSLKGDILLGGLEAAMLEVVMGADISVYDRAVTNWLNDGGNQITNEVNQWYRGLRK